MTLDATLTGHPVVAALARVDAALDEAGEGCLWGLSDEDLLGLLAGCERLAARLAGLGVALAGEADVRGVASRLGAPSTAALLRERLRLHPREAAARVRLAGNPDLAATRAALGAGEVSTGHARVIAATVRALPAPVRGQAEGFLVEQAGGLDPERLGRLGAHLREVVDPDGLEPEERAAAARRELSLADRGDGTHALRGVLDNEAAARLLAALDPLAAPAPAADGTPDPRTAAQRRADALMRIVDWVLDEGTLLPGARPHVTIVAGLDTLLRRPGAPAADPTWGGPVSAETLRRIACDAGLTGVLTDQHGVPLHVGREHRSVTPGIWAALVVRDRGCAFPSCTRPPSWTEAHHCTHWADGGPTALDNLALLCAHHHKSVHHDGWDITIADDGLPQLRPPAWIDPDRTPRRNTYWRIRDRLPPPDGP